MSNLSAHTPNQIRERALSQVATLDDPALHRIAEGHWRNAPRRLLRPYLQSYALDRARVLDVGSSFGQALGFFGPGSVGIEFEAAGVDFSRQLGLEAHICDIFSDDLYNVAPRRSFDAIWFCAVIEHLNSPHLALMHLRQCLRPGGLMFMVLPTIPPAITDWLIRAALMVRQKALHRPLLAYESTDHVNGFTLSTARFLVERTGFQIVETNCLNTRAITGSALLGQWLAPLSDTLMVVARVDHEWDYPSKATRRVDEMRGWRWNADRGSLAIAPDSSGQVDADAAHPPAQDPEATPQPGAE